MKFVQTLLLCLSIACSIQGQSFELTVSSDSVLLGNYIEVKFVVENLDGKFEAPTFDGMEIISGPNTSSSIQIINEDRSSTTSYSFYVKPPDVGSYTVTPAYLILEEETRETIPLTINVYPNPDNIITTPESGSHSFFFEFGNDSPFFQRTVPPTSPTPPVKPKRKYKKL